MPGRSWTRIRFGTAPMNNVLHSDSATDLSRLLVELGEEARAFRFAAAPNPCVGAVVLDSSGEELGRGFHRRWGAKHAEISAMAAAEAAGHPKERWHTLVVTLEPCSTAGKTGACTDAILAAGFSRLVVGCLDPSPEHRGRGLQLLDEHGLDVQFQPTGPPLEEVAPHFLRWIDYERLRRPRPWMIAKWAQTRSGHLTPPAEIGDGRWISGPDALAEVHQLRAGVDAILTGVGTVKADDPRLTVRGVPGATKAPMRIVLDTELSTPPDARLFEEPEAGALGGPVVLLCRAGANAKRHRDLLEAGARIHGLRPDAEGHVALREALAWMWRFDIRRAMLESGPTLIQALFEAGFVDQLRIYTGDVSGGEGDTLGPLIGRLRLDQRLEREVGPDAVLEGFPQPILL